MGGAAFIGVGYTAEGPELPMGLGMKLPFHPQAMDAYGRMSTDEREALVRFIQSGASGQEVKRRIDEALQKLSQGQTSGF